MLLRKRSITLSMGLNQLLAVAICAGLLVAAEPAATELYRWTDDKGQLHFTSDKSKIPRQFRNQDNAKSTSSQTTVTRTESSGVGLGGESELHRRIRLRREAKANALKRSQRSYDDEKKPVVKAPPPRKYVRDCEKRNRNGRCGRKLNPAWSPPPPEVPVSD
ncbi:MAG: DUF4124 domain-containing protein [Deltaproteobacteria bacterium]|nr:MAG: DUF4124 domain-containing protein [Deltaproteobacteria bacterium]